MSESIVSQVIKGIHTNLFRSQKPHRETSEPPAPDKMTAEDYIRHREDLFCDRQQRRYDLELWFSKRLERLALRAEADGLVDSCGRFPHHEDYGKDMYVGLPELPGDKVIQAFNFKAGSEPDFKTIYEAGEGEELIKFEFDPNGNGAFLYTSRGVYEVTDPFADSPVFRLMEVAKDESNH